MRKTWYNMKAASGNMPATISICDEIGMWGVSAKDFITSFRQIADNDITLELNTPGGSVFDALAMFNAMKSSGKNITVKVMGIAASAGSYLAMVGNKIVMPENTFMMVHNPLNGIYGNAADMREMADVLDKIGNSLTATYVARTGKSDEDVRALLAEDTYMTAAECLAHGFCDEVIPAVTATAKFEREHLPANIQALFKSAEDDTDDATDDGTVDAADDATDEPVATFADQVMALTTTAGLQDFAPAMVLAMTSLDEVKLRIVEAREIRALCAVAQQADMTSKFINSGASIGDVRIALCELLAKSDDSVGVDTTQLSSEKPTIGTCQSAVVKTADILAKYRNNSRSKK